MPTLISTDLAAVSTGSGLYLYFQEGTKLLEAHSDDGTQWAVSKTAVAEDLNPNYSPITAFHVQNDGSLGSKSTIHVFWINKDGLVFEKAKVLSGGEDSWKPIKFPKDVKPTEGSTLGSGVCHDDTNAKSHQWLHFITDFKGNSSKISEYRLGSSSSWDWELRKDLEEDAAEALRGTSIAEYLTSETTHLFFQDHGYNILHYTGGYETWKKPPTTAVTKASPITPLAACGSGTPEKPYLFYISSSAAGGAGIQQWQEGKEPQRVAPWAPGSRLGAVRHKGQVYLFGKQAVPPFSIITWVYSAGGWKAGKPVVK